MTDDEVSLAEEVVSHGAVRTGAGLIAAGALLSTVGVAVCCSAAVAGLRRRLTSAVAPPAAQLLELVRETATADDVYRGAAERLPSQRRTAGTQAEWSSSGQRGRRG